MDHIDPQGSDEVKFLLDLEEAEVLEPHVGCSCQRSGDRMIQFALHRKKGLVKSPPSIDPYV